MLYPRKASGREVLRSLQVSLTMTVHLKIIAYSQRLGPLGAAFAVSFTGNNVEHKCMCFHSTSCNFHISKVLQAPPSQSLGVFTSVVVIVSFGSLVVTIQAKASLSLFMS